MGVLILKSERYSRVGLHSHAISSVAPRRRPYPRMQEPEEIV